MDRLDGSSRLRLKQLEASLRQLHDFDAVFHVSALKGRGLPDVREYLASRFWPSSACF